MCNAAGQWTELKKARFTADATARKKEDYIMRAELKMEVSSSKIVAFLTRKQRSTRALHDPQRVKNQ